MARWCRFTLALALTSGACADEPSDVCEVLDAANEGEPAMPVAASELFGELDTPGSFLATRGHGGYTCDPGVAIDERTCPLDIHAVRWDPPADSYTRSRTRSDVPQPYPFSDDVMWGMPLHSPVDGVVIACWRGMPDDDVEDDGLNCPGGATNCIQGGNHLNILSDDGELWYFGHLQQDSIPLDVCPIDEVYLYQSDSKSCELEPPWEGMRRASRLDLRGIDPPRVTAGQLVGRVGTSGSGIGVHVHVHRKPFVWDDAGNPCEAPSLPYAFDRLWIQDRDGEPGGDWIAVHGQALPIDGRSWLLWPGWRGEPPGARDCE